MSLPAPVAIIGIDAATQPRNTGLALGTSGPGGLEILEVAVRSSRDEIVDTLAEWCTEETLIAIDAPLGWPAEMGPRLDQHQAGETIDADANRVFRRRTDDVIFDAFGKRPLDVGSNLIARSAHSVLDLLGRLRTRIDQPIPLAWSPSEDASVRAIEVYPAVTLRSRELSDRGYKGGKPDAVSARESLLVSLEPEAAFHSSIADHAQRTDHVLDAILCVVAGFDFLAGRTMPPEDEALARREGWIWAPRPRQSESR